MRLKLVAIVLIMAIAMAGCVASRSYYSSGYYGTSVYRNVQTNGNGYYWQDNSYEYYNLPSGYQYERWDTGPVIVNALTREIVTLAALRLMYPKHNWHRRYYKPYFVRDYRIPAHRAKWGLRHPRYHRGNAYRPQRHRGYMPAHIRPAYRPNHKPNFNHQQRPYREWKHNNRGQRHNVPNRYRFDRHNQNGRDFRQNGGKPPR